MKKKWLVIVAAVVLLLALTAGAFAANPIKIIVNGQVIKPDVPPQIINGRTMVPIRWLAKALGVDVEWDGNNGIVKLTSVVERSILFTRIAFSKDWQKATKPPYQELPELRDLYNQNFYVITGNSEGSKVFDTLGVDKLERVSSNIAVPEGSLGIFTVYSSIIGITVKGQNIIIYVQPQDAGYDFVAIEPVVATLPYKESGSGEKMFTFIFKDTKGKELTRIVKMCP
ncbi:copper amine oxidase N-terminal domain-containing protein [Thermoanaerobacter sp. A7A]|uniref:copper amine oxidase N-terminal domain-containing protein n=1 Tax=Thermoanaerobacter sp. A7A TaxID=1350366 RepID=UPI000415AE9D|nr:copper amine oxidase N-terminal domain-containing protein [Thermoanaerobacter sp. A7A]